MAELPHSASSSDDPYVPLFPPDVEGELQDGDEVPMLKWCGLCENYKPMEEFHKDASRKDGKQNRCKVCHRNRNIDGKEKGHNANEDGNATQDEEPSRKRIKSKGDVIKFRGEDLYVLKNSRLPEYKIGCSGDIDARSNGLQKSQNFYILKVAIFPGKGYLEDTVRDMLRYCLLSREVAAGEEWHTCSLQVALAAIGQAIENDNAQR